MIIRTVAVLPLTKNRVNLDRRVWSGRRLRRRAASFLRELGLAFPIRVAFDGNNLGVMGESIDQGDRAGRIGKDRVSFLER